jgi:hypothetical protein
MVALGAQPLRVWSCPPRFGHLGRKLSAGADAGATRAADDQKRARRLRHAQTRVVLVTGANRGIGREFARQLAMGGDAVVLTARDLGKAERAAAALSGPEPVLARRLDVTDLATAEQVAADGTVASAASHE